MFRRKDRDHDIQRLTERDVMFAEDFRIMNDRLIAMEKSIKRLGQKRSK